MKLSDAQMERGRILLFDADPTDDIHRLAVHLYLHVEALKAERGTCHWYKDEDGIWHTECQVSWDFEAGGLPSEHKMRYCHHCGRTLSEHLY